MWTNSPKHKESNLQGFIGEGNMKVGQSLAVLGQLENYNGQIQLNIQKLKVVDDFKDELHHFYYQTIDTQKRLFDPFSRPSPNPYYRSLSCLSAENPEILELIVDINKEHEDYVNNEQNIIYQEKDVQLENQIE
jgi:hypothetical protein